MTSMAGKLWSWAFGWETYEEAYARILKELEESSPEMTPEEIRLHNEKARFEVELLRKRLDGPNGERGMEGFQ